MARQSTAGLYKRPDGVYEKIITINGKRVAFRSKDPAKVWQKMAAHREKEEKGLRFEEIAEEWEIEHLPTLTHNTQMGYKPAIKRIKHEFKNYYTKEIDAPTIENYIRGFAAPGRGHNTVKNELLIIRMIFDFACAKGYLEYSPARYIKVPKGLKKEARVYPSDKDIETVKSSINAPYGLLHYLILYSGLRLGEALALQWRDIDFKNKEISVTKSLYFESNQPKIKTPKTDKGTRTVILLDKLSAVLKPLKGIGDDYIFLEQERLPSRTMVDRGKQRYRKNTGATCSPHQLRHAFATMLFEAGIDSKTAQYLLGHAQLSTTMDIYTELRQHRLIDTAKKLNSIDYNTVNTQ